MAGAVSAYEATLVGDQLGGDNKWFSSVLAADGNIYGIPLQPRHLKRECLCA